MNILIVKYGALGDVVRTSYFLKPLSEKYPDAGIYWLTSKNSKELLIYNPYITFLTDNINELKEVYFDWVISLDDESEILSKINLLKFNKITGAYLDENNNHKYTKDAELWFDMGIISKFGKEKADELKKKNQLTHDEIFSEILNINNIQPCFFNSFAIENRIKIQFSNEYFHIGINSGAGKRWPSKSMNTSEVVNLINHLCNLRIKNKNVFIHLLGGNDEQERNKLIKQNATRCKFIDIVETSHSLLEFAAVIKYCDYIITSDSLALHFAISQGIPNLSFYAPTSANEINTFGTGIKVLTLSEDYCSYKPDCDNSSITAERIINAFKKHILI